MAAGDDAESADQLPVLGATAVEQSRFVGTAASDKICRSASAFPGDA